MILTTEFITTITKLIAKGFFDEDLISTKEIPKFEDVITIALQESSKENNITEGDIRCHTVGNLVIDGLVEDCSITDGQAEDDFQNTMEEIVTNVVEEELKALAYVKDYYDDFGNFCAHTDSVLENRTGVTSVITNDKKTLKVIKERQEELKKFLYN